jgi:TIR domain/Pentapeptide repeats (8 copies)
MACREVHPIQVYNPPVFLQRTFSPGFKLLRQCLIEATHRAGTGSNAHLNGANLDGANLSNTYWHGAVAWATIFANVDLRETKGLAEIEHAGPSTVALYTVQLPQNGGALHFLRDTGVPDEWIDLYCTKNMHPVLYYSCFISYSSQDVMLARRLHADLQDQGVRCWFAPEDMKIGDKIRPRIDKAIHMQDKLLLLLSKHAIESSWVEVEVESAFDKESRQKREVLFPVRLDESVMQTSHAWARTICQTRHIGDFTHWMDPQEYQQTFERLLRDLKKADRD